MTAFLGQFLHLNFYSLMNFKAKLLASFVGLCLSLSACAQNETPEQLVKKRLAERLTNLPEISSVTASPLKGIYEVVIEGPEIYYTDEKAEYLMRGDLFDIVNKVNLTEAKTEKLTTVAFKDLPTKDAITVVKGKGTKKIAVFEDPNCGYCKRFEADLQKLDDVTIYLYLYPILGSDSTVKSKNIWCAADKNKAWTAWMLKNEVPASANSACNTEAVTRNVELGKKFKITGTPTVIFQNGTRVPGAIPLEKLKEAIAERS